MRYFIAACLVFLAPIAARAGEPQAPIEDQLRVLGSLLYRTSCCNVINGLNLTRDQAVELRELAKRLEAAGATAPHPQGALSKDVEEVSQTYQKLLDALLDGKEVSDTLRAEVMQARKTESSVIAKTLSWDPSATPRTCARCHQEPGTGERTPIPASARPEQGYAHFAAGVGRKGLVALVAIAKKVDAILTPEQKSVLSDFSCCLVPPKGMSDPVRVGQAEVSDQVLEGLQKARSTPADQWPAAKKVFLAAVERGAFLRHPDLTDADRQALRDRVGAALDKARAMNDADFEMAKADLAKEITGKDPQPPQEKSALQAAFFLLQPGADRAYDRLMDRLDHPAKVDAPKELPNALNGGAT